MARSLAWAAGVIAVIGLSGWIFRMPALTGAVFGFDSMVPATAVMIALCSVAIVRLTDTPSSRNLATAVGTFVLLAAVAVIARDVVRIMQGIVQLEPGQGITESSTGATAWPAPNTAASLAFVAIAILLESRDRSRHASLRRLLGGAATIALLIAIMTLVGYAYGVSSLRGIPGHRTMALNTAIAVSSLAAAVLVRSAGLGHLLVGTDPGAMLARLFLPAVLIAPFVLGLLRLAGDRAGWFDPPMGTALRTMAEMALFASLVVLAARRLRHVAADRDEALDAQRTIADEASNETTRARQLLDAVIDQLPVGVVLARIPSGEVVRRNRMGEDIAAVFNRGPQQQGDPIVWHRPDGTRYDVSDYPLTRTVRTQEVIEQEEMTAYRPDGTPVHIAVSAAPVYKNGVPTMAVAVFADVSTRRAAETALADRDALLASFFRAPDVMISLVEADVSGVALGSPDVDYRFLLTNAQTAAVFGKTEADLVGRTAGDLGIDTERRRSFVQLLAEARRTGKPSVTERPALPEKVGPRSPKWFSIVVSPLADQPGRLPRFCLFATDVSRQRQLEEELRQSQKLEAVGRLAGGIAHDFNNLLTAITGFTQFALSEVPARSPVRDDLDQALRAADRAATLTHQLLAFSRQQVLQPQVLNLNQVVTDIEPMLRRVIGENIAIHRKLEASLGNVKSDRNQIEQVIVNLAVNARDAMPEGGQLSFETAEVYLEPSQVDTMQGGSPGPHIMLAVSDTGVGMSHETRDRIFEPFFTTKESGRGTGLGLATVFGIVKQSGGAIWVYSEPGHGSTFKVYLPRHDGPTPVPRHPTPVPAFRGAGRLLLIEDDRAVRLIAARILRRAGYDVVEAANGREAVDVYRKMSGKFDLIVTDLVLPGLGGRAVIRSLAAEGNVPPVVYMSGYTAEAMSAQSILEPGDQFVEKPFTSDSLLAKVTEALQAAQHGPRRVG